MAPMGRYGCKPPDPRPSGPAALSLYGNRTRREHVVLCTYTTNLKWLNLDNTDLWLLFSFAADVPSEERRPCIVGMEAPLGTLEGDNR